MMRSETAAFKYVLCITWTIDFAWRMNASSCDAMLMGPSPSMTDGGNHCLQLIKSRKAGSGHLDLWQEHLLRHRSRSIGCTKPCAQYTPRLHRTLRKLLRHRAARIKRRRIGARSKRRILRGFTPSSCSSSSSHHSFYAYAEALY
jgi:hypothetical protein